MLTTQDSLERGHLLRAVQFLESAERESVGCRATRPAALPATEYGSYLDDEIGAVLMRIKDYAETIGGTAAGMHAYEQQLSESEQEDAQEDRAATRRGVRRARRLTVDPIGSYALPKITGEVRLKHPVDRICDQGDDGGNHGRLHRSGLRMRYHASSSVASPTSSTASP